MSDLVEFLNARYDEDEWWAREASRLRDQEGQPAGDHWQWEATDIDQVLVLDPSQYEHVNDGVGSVSLRSRELYPTNFVGDLPNFAIGAASEVPTTVAGHVVRHDPARVLAEVEAKRRIVESAAEIMDRGAFPEGVSDGRDPDEVESDEGLAALAEYHLRLLALPYADHPDYREEWRP
jgi:hypothetical protein